MKKYKIAGLYLCILGLMFFISCEKHSDPVGPSTTASTQSEWQITNGPCNAYIASMGIHPNGTLFAGTIETGVYRFYYDKNIWTKLNLGGNWSDARSIAFDQQGRIYVGTGGGNIYRSSDLGDHWTHVASGLTSDFIGSIMVAPDNHIFAGSNSGVYRSTDQGSTWAKTNKGLPTNVVIYSLMCGNNNVVYAGGDGGSGIFCSLDDGNTWTSMNTVSNGLFTMSLMIDRNNRIFAGTLNQGVYISTDNGTSWSYSGLNSVHNVTSFGLDSTGNVIVATLSGIYRLTNNSSSWSLIQTETSISPPLSIASTQSNQLYVGTSSSGVIHSTDNGTSWSQCNFGLEPVGIASLTSDNNGNMVAGSGGIGNIYFSSDEGLSWKRVYTGISYASISSLNLDQHGAILAGTYYGSVLRSTDNGANWTPFCLGNISSNITSLSLLQNGHIIAGTDGAQVYKSIDNGQSWNLVDTAASHGSVYSIFAYSNQIYSCTRFGGVYSSSDEGLSWKQINTGLTCLEARGLISNSSGDLFLGTWGGGIYRSSNSGNTWIQTNANHVSGYIRSLAIRQDGTIYACLGNAGIMRTNDNGNTWAQLNAGLNAAEVDAITIIPNGRIVIGGSGIFKSKSLN